VSNKHVDVADTVVDDSPGRTVQQHNLGAHREYVLMTRSHFIVNDGTKAKSQPLNLWIVSSEKREQLAWRLRVLPLTPQDGLALREEDEAL
jgi:hypothetical protein